jgi:DNA-binding NarL/FixJ family response regulator
MIAEFEVASLFDPVTIAMHRATDPATSKIAALAVTPRLSNLEARVFDAIAAAGSDGLTTHELADRLDLSLVTVSPRIRPLCRKGKVKNSGRKRTGESGCPAIVWCAT